MKNTPIPVAVRTVDTGIGMKLSLYRIFNCWRSSWKVFKGKMRQLRMMLINLLRVVVVQELVREGSVAKGTGKIDYDLAKDYIRDVESKTGLKLHKTK